MLLSTVTGEERRTPRSMRSGEGLRGPHLLLTVPRGCDTIPAMRIARQVRIMAGFFSSHSFAQLAPGLAAFLDSENEPLEMLISPKISEEDREAIRRAVIEPSKVAEDAMTRLFEGAHASESAIAAKISRALALSSTMSTCPSSRPVGGSNLRSPLKLCD